MIEQEFRKIILDHQDRIYNTCLGFVKNPEDAKDLAQETFIEVYKKLDQFRGDAQLSTWIYRIAINKSLEFIRKGKRLKRAAVVQSLSEPGIDTGSQAFYHPGVTLENKERASILFKAIERLPENQQVAFTMHKVEGLSYEDVGKVMNKSISSVESLLHRAKANLKKHLKAFYETEKS